MRWQVSAAAIVGITFLALWYLSSTEERFTFASFPAAITPTTRLAPTDTDVTINGPSSNDRSGTDLAVGDINNDGIPDILIGAKGASASGEAYVVFGPLSAGTL